MKTPSELQRKLHDLVGRLMSLEAEAEKIGWKDIIGGLAMARIHIVEAARKHEPPKEVMPSYDLATFVKRTRFPGILKARKWLGDEVVIRHITDFLNGGSGGIMRGRLGLDAWEGYDVVRKLEEYGLEQRGVSCRDDFLPFRSLGATSELRQTFVCGDTNK